MVGRDCLLIKHCLLSSLLCSLKRSISVADAVWLKVRMMKIEVEDDDDDDWVEE